MLVVGTLTLNVICVSLIFLVVGTLILGLEWLNDEQRKILKLHEMFLELCNRLEGRCVQCHLDCLLQVHVTIVCLCVNVYMNYFFYFLDFVPFVNCCLGKGCECNCCGMSCVFNFYF